MKVTKVRKSEVHALGLEPSGAWGAPEILSWRLQDNLPGKSSQYGLAWPTNPLNIKNLSVDVLFGDLSSLQWWRKPWVGEQITGYGLPAAVHVPISPQEDSDFVLDPDHVDSQITPRLD